MRDDFGGRLRRRREEKGVSLAAIAEQTKIKASLLEALERNDVSQWPPGIFRRAYIRSYAAAVGLDADVVVHEFLALHPDRAERFAEEPTVVAADDGRTSAPPTRLRYLMDSAIGSLGRRRRVPTPVPTTAPPSVEKQVSPGPDLVSAFSVDVPVSAEPAIVAVSPLAGSVSADPTLMELARLSTTFGRIGRVEDIQPLLLDAATLLQASGLIVWAWDERAEGLRPVLTAGYSDRILAQLPTLPPDADNVTADAFRSGRTCSIPGADRSNAALVVPMLGATRCTGVLALELPCTGEPAASVQAMATVLAALLALVIGDTASIEADPRAEGTRPRDEASPNLRAMRS